VIEGDFGVRRNGIGREARRSRQRPGSLPAPTLPGLPQKLSVSANRGSNAGARCCNPNASYRVQQVLRGDESCQASARDYGVLIVAADSYASLR
jgi:hypothetical protein